MWLRTYLNTCPLLSIHKRASDQPFWRTDLFFKRNKILLHFSSKIWETYTGSSRVISWKSIILQAPLAFKQLWLEGVRSLGWRIFTDAFALTKPCSFKLDSTKSVTSRWLPILGENSQIRSELVFILWWCIPYFCAPNLQTILKWCSEGAGRL